MATYTTWNNNNVSLPDSWTRGYNTVRWYFGSTTTRYIQVLRGTYSGFSRYVNWGDYNYIDFVTIVSSMYSYDYSRSQYYYDYTMDCSEWSGNSYYCQFMMATSYSNPSTVYCYKANNGGEFYVSFGSTPTSYTYSYAIKYNYYPYTTDNWRADSDTSTNTSYTFSLPNEYPSRDGYTCTGFATSSGGSASYSKGSDLSLTSSSPSKTLYCVWEQEHYKLTVNASTGISYIRGYWSDTYYWDYIYIDNGSSQTKDFGQSTGWFNILEIGYSTSPVYSYPVYENGSTTLIDSNGDVQRSYTIDAVRGGTTSTITATAQTRYYALLNYNANQGSGAPSSQTGSAYGGSSASVGFTCSSVIPTRSGYRFLGWANSSGATSPNYVGGDTITITATSKYSSNPTPKTVYAVWENISYTYELEIVDGFGATCDTFTSTTTATSKSWTVPSYSSSYPSHNGYVFKYWKYYQAIYYPNETITLYYNDPTGVLTAQWNVDTDTFYLQLGTITSSSITVRITGLTAKSYARTVDFVCNGVTKTVTVSANSTSSSYVTFTGLSSESGYEINATLKVDSLTLGSNYIDAYPLLNFAWTNVIAQGYPISNLTASDWNEYNRLLTIKAIRHNKTHSYTTVSTGTIIYATYYNAVCNSLRNINSNYNINNVASGDQVIATPFNTMVTYLNTDDN